MHPLALLIAALQFAEITDEAEIKETVPFKILNVNTIPNSQYLKVKVLVDLVDDKLPTIEQLKVLSRVLVVIWKPETKVKMEFYLPYMNPGDSPYGLAQYDPKEQPVKVMPLMLYKYPEYKKFVKYEYRKTH